MPNPRLAQIIAKLPFERKLVGIGSILMVVSLFFPWYQDIDSFHTGDTFTGLTGPLYFAGFTFLVLASISILMMVMDYLDRQIPIFKMKTSKFHLWTGVFSFYMLFLIGSVYFHPAFGVNITLKQSGFGMFTAYAAAALMTIGGYMEGRGKAAIKAFEKETREEPVKEQEVTPRVVETKVVHPMIERKPRESLRNMKPVQPETPQQPAMDLGNAEQTPVHAQPAAAPAQAAAKPAEPQKESHVQPYRMDL